jgi:hypothetical protein
VEVDVSWGVEVALCTEVLGDECYWDEGEFRTEDVVAVISTEIGRKWRKAKGERG